MNEVQSKLNANLVIDLNKSISLTQFKNLKGYLRGAHAISDVRELEKAEEVGKLIDSLIRNKKIQFNETNGYQLLIDGLNRLGECVLAEEVEKYQADIVKAGTPKPVVSDATSGAASSPTNPPGGSTVMNQTGNTVSGKNISNMQIHAQGGNVNIG